MQQQSHRAGRATEPPTGAELFPTILGGGMLLPALTPTPSEPPAGPADAERARILRIGALAKLKRLQEDLSTCDVSPVLMPQYLSLLQTLTLGLSAAKSVEQLEAVDLHLTLVNTAWERTERNETKRRWALVVAALVFALIVAGLLSISGIIYLMTGTLPIISNLMVPGINVPVYVLLWSAIGSCTAVLYRINRAVDMDLEDPVRLMVAQPIISVVMGTVSYLIVQLGLLTLTSDPTASGLPDANGIENAAEQRITYFLSFMAFLVGFSDRFANRLLQTLAGRFGGESDADLVMRRATMVSIDGALLNAALEAVGRQAPVADAAPRPDASAPGQDQADPGSNGRANGAAPPPEPDSQPAATPAVNPAPVTPAHTPLTGLATPPSSPPANRVASDSPGGA